MLEIFKTDRQRLKGHKSYVLWFTGLSGSGKTTLAKNLEYRLYKHGIHTYVLDGDVVRNGLNKDLGFSEEDRKENIRRVGEVSKILVDAGIVVLSAFISPFEQDRLMVKELFEEDEFIEIYVKCPLEICESRDVKGLYEKARKGLIKDFTGIDSPYEVPRHPDIVVETDKESIYESVEKIFEFLYQKELLKGLKYD